MSTYAFEVLVLFIINCFPESRTSTLAVLEHLVMFFSLFDWEKQIVTCCGVVSDKERDSDMEAGGGKELKLNYKTVEKIRGELKCERKEWQGRLCNVSDPAFHGNNLGKNVSASSLARIKLAFQVAAEIIVKSGVEGLFSKQFPQISIDKTLVFEEKPQLEVVPVSYFANIRKLKEALYSCLSVMDPSFPQNYKCYK
jgi:hypothetical protein